MPPLPLAEGGERCKQPNTFTSACLDRNGPAAVGDDHEMHDLTIAVKETVRLLAATEPNGRQVSFTASITKTVTPPSAACSVRS